MVMPETNIGLGGGWQGLPPLGQEVGVWLAWHPVPLLCSLGSFLVMDGEVCSQLC